MNEYDGILDIYLAHVERPDSWNNLYERPSMCSLLPDLRGKNVLDLGCASGYYTDHALSRGASVTSIDIAEGWIERLRSRHTSPALRPIRADISRPMPFLETESFDCIIASLVMHYFRDWTVTVNEMHRVLRPGGCAVISTHHPFMTDRLFQPENFHDCYEVEDTWGKGEYKFKVHYYIRSLEDTLKPFIESPFRIKKISEALPGESVKEAHPDIYDRLRSKPSFLFIVIEK